MAGAPGGGRRGAAIDLTLAAADLAKQSGQNGIEMAALHDAIRFGDRTSLQRLVDVCAQVDGQLAPVHAAAATALLNRDADGMYAAAQQFEQIGAMLSAADTAAQAAVLFDARDTAAPPPKPQHWPTGSLLPAVGSRRRR